MINSVMNRLQDFTFFSQLMANANMGWWKANLSTANYECSDFIVELLGLDQTGVISFDDFNKRIQKEEQHSATFHSFGVYQWPEVVYLIRRSIRQCQERHSCTDFHMNIMRNIK